MEWESDSPCHSHMYLRQGHSYPRRCSNWELEGILAQSWREGCHWLKRDGPREHERGVCDGKYLWREARQPWKQGDTAESCIVGGAITIASLSPQASIDSWTIERLAHQMPDTLNYRVGPYPGCSFKWLMHQTREKDPRQGSPLRPEQVELRRKTGQRGFLIASYQRFGKRLW